jgi:S-adenosylmethionine:tRNA ribosyltransferase-isomerase
MPADKRDNSKMLVLNREKHTIEHKYFYDIVDFIDKDTLLVLNNTKVLPARLYGTKETGAKIEVFLLEAQSEGSSVWSCLIKPSKRIKSDTVITISEDLKVKPIKRLEDDGEWLVELIYSGDLFDILHKVGNLPLPPYIERKLQTEDIKNFDKDRYQTVYAKDEGSVAAPTAGLHFTQEILDKLKAKGVEIAYVTLNVGMGTFRPVKCENILEHKMHSEEFEISKETADRINQAKKQGKNIVAVGTTSVRTLETAFKQFGEITECKSHSELFIYPGYEFKVVDKILTNFHLPKSTLLMLISAFATKDYIFNAYNEAIKSSYRFYSYGDCMFIQ